MTDRDRLYRSAGEEHSISKEELRIATCRSELVLEVKMEMSLIPIRMGVRTLGILVWE